MLNFNAYIYLQILFGYSVPTKLQIKTLLSCCDTLDMSVSR